MPSDRKIRIQVGNTIAAAQLDDGDGLSGSGGGGIVIELGHGGRSVGGVAGGARSDSHYVPAQARLGLRPVIESEHADQQRGDGDRDDKLTGAAAENAARRLVELDLSAESLVHIGDGSSENHAPPPQVHFDHGEVVFSGELLDALHVGRIGTVAACELLPRDGAGGRGKFFAVPQNEGDFDQIVWIGAADRNRIRYGAALAAAEHRSFFRHNHLLFVRQEK